MSGRDCYNLSRLKVRAVRRGEVEAAYIHSRRSGCKDPIDYLKLL